MVNNTGAGNILLPWTIMFTENTFERISEMFDSINIPHFSKTLFYSIQKTLLFPTLNSFYKRYRTRIINICTTREGNNFIGDGRSDSPRYSAKYGTYSLVGTDLNKIVDFFVVHVSTAGNSSRIGKKWLQTLLEKCSNSVKITTLTTDRHVQIRSFLTLFRMGGWGVKKAPPTSFPPVTSTNVGFGPKNFLTFSFNPFATLVQNFKFVPSACPKLLNLNQDHPSIKANFLVKSL